MLCLFESGRCKRALLVQKGKTKNAFVYWEEKRKASQNSFGVGWGGAVGGPASLSCLPRLLSKAGSLLRTQSPRPSRRRTARRWLPATPTPDLRIAPSLLLLCLPYLLPQGPLLVELPLQPARPLLGAVRLLLQAADLPAHGLQRAQARRHGEQGRQSRAARTKPARSAAQRNARRGVAPASFLGWLAS